MCGRYASFQQNQDLLDAFLIDPTLPLDPELAQWQASWNVAPTQDVRMVVERSQQSSEQSLPPVRSLRLARWGLVPSWAKSPDMGARMINARAESVLDKPAYQRAFAKRRCVIPADGFYEWRSPRPGSRSKVPYFIYADDGGPLALGGLYEFWRDPAKDAADPARWLVTCTILTAAAEEDLAQIHDRRPVILAREHWDAWLDPAVGADEAAPLLTASAPNLTWHAVGTGVNAAANNGPELISAQETPSA